MIFLINKKLHNLFLLPLISISLFFSSVAFYLSINRYNNFVFGKFDLGNMNQMLYNSARFNFMIISDYFGSNVPRWSMSHVDPLLLILIPFNWFYSDASLLLAAQNLCFLLSSFLVYKISREYKINLFHSWVLSLLVFLMPMSGFILVWTTFHPTAIAVPIYLLIYFLLLKNKKSNFIKNNIFFNLSIFVLTILFILGKEELGIVFAASVPFLLTQFKRYKKLLIFLSLISALWSFLCLFIIIPHYTTVRNQSLSNFVKSEKIEGDFSAITKSNYFLYRYSEFGNSYSEIAQAIILNPENFISVLISKNNVNTLNKILLPTFYSIFINPYLFIAFIPETLIQLLSNDPEVFSITNHRLLPIMPFLFLGNVLMVVFLYQKKFRYTSFLLLVLLFFNVYLSISYKSPLVYTLYDKTLKYFSLSINKVYATENYRAEFNNSINKQCANFLLKNINSHDAVSVPQPLGAKTSNRKFNALFPTGIDKSDIFIADIFDRKIVDFLEVSTNVNKKIVAKYLTSENYNFNLEYACDRFFLFRNSKSGASNNLNNLGSVEILTDFEEPLIENKKILLNQSYFINHRVTKIDSSLSFEYTYYLGDESSRNKIFVYTILESNDSRWQFVNLPSYYLLPINNIPVKSYVSEKFTLKIPEYVHAGEYKLYFGMGNGVENNTFYVGDIKL